MTMAYVAVAAVVIGGVMTAASSVQQGRAAKANAQFQADQLAENAKTARAEAGATEEDQREKARQIIGTQMAAQAQSGAQLNGSASDMLRQSLFSAESDAQRIRYSGENAARGMGNQATGALFSGSQASKNANLSAAGTLMSTAGSAYGGYKKATG